MGCSFLILAMRIFCFSAIIALVLFLLGAGTLIILHILIIARACRQALRSLVNGGEGFVGTGNGLSVKELEKLPGFEFSTPEEKGGANCCAVCLESFEFGDRCRLLPACHHSFHARCVDCWLVRSSICPICRCSQVAGGAGNEVVPSSD
ncbi:RING-H2 finger protein ATL74-like [Phalaenopsis equestris]|uniref:RING-H2 finger protein ATL74-like n=1 Tax=Phalaenopsis equestris TaxID=78828 RepID=UPI0009E49C38|nr:RING-H2 finger protein ATL74-like [Phalaenopsis equestris]